MHFLTFRRFVPPRVANEKGVPEILTTCNTVTFTPSQQTGRPLLEKKKSFVCWTNWSSFFDKHTFTLLNQQYKDGSTVHLLVLLVITLLLEIGRVVKHSKKVIRRTVRSSLLAGSGIVIMCVCVFVCSVCDLWQQTHKKSLCCLLLCFCFCSAIEWGT